MNDLIANTNRSVTIFAVVFFVLTLLSGAGFFGAIFSTLIASAIVYGVLRYFAAKRANEPPR